MLENPKPNQHWDATHEILVQRGAKHLPSEKICVFPFFAANSEAEYFRLPKNSTLVNCDVANAIKH